ncbi:MAG: bifunctional hydroxymethylpyrimidine kinase/phosphomethylpyrimidine kinase [Geobacter sp.]|nr:bifunctional hydroxymethylpyrimidine kinase/phosphomethylpyrimidine kinase [Geobacter sp.]
MSGVYLITDQQDNLLERVAQALRGGVATLQYRAKDKPYEFCLEEGNSLKRLCSRFGSLFIVNDDLKLAHDLDADGVHLGQDDGAPQQARELLGPNKIIGVSTHNLEEALKAEADGADYLGFGAMYPTDSKNITHMPGTSGLAAIRDRVKLPIVAIGGISPANACRVIEAGADAVAVISSVLSAPTPEVAATELRLLFNRLAPYPRGGVLTVAGSDSGGGAGIQADLKTITLLGSYGASAITALTAQNTRGVKSIHGIPPSFVRDQIDTVLTDLPIDLIKTGMLHTPAIISLLADYLTEQTHYYPVVIDPVMVAKGGASLLELDAVAIFQETLLPHAYLLTPNVPEAERLINCRINSEAAMEQAARQLHSMGAANVLLKGGHMSGGDAVDILFDGQSIHRFTSERFFTSATHGTGCSFASAIAAYLAQGEPLKEAVRLAKNFITNAIRLARPMGKGHGPINHYLAVQEQHKPD